MQRIAILICYLLLICCSCREAAVPEPELYLQMDMPQYVHVNSDNSLDYVADGVLQSIKQGDILSSQAPTAGGPVQRRGSSMNREAELLIPGPDGWFLQLERNRRFMLINRDVSLESITLPEPELISGVLNFSMGGVSPQAGFLAEGPVCLYRGQLCVAYDMQGKERWQYMLGGYSSLAISPAGDRLCIAGGDTRARCLDGSGQLIWERKGMYQLLCSSSGPMLRNTLLPEIASLDWDGNVLWEMRWPSDDFRVSMLASEVLPQLVVITDESLASYDAEGRLNWQTRHAPGWARGYALADDGHVFLRLMDEPVGDSLLNGRLARQRSRSGTVNCYDPQGNLIWQLDDASLSGNTYIPGYAGHILLQDDQDRLVSYGPALD